MLEMKITITAPDLAAAINNLAAALNSKNPHTVCNQYGENKHQFDNAGAISMDMGGKAQPVSPVEPVNPTPAPDTQQSINSATMRPTVNPTPSTVAIPMQTPGVPLSATPAQTAAQTAPAVPVAPPAPAVTPVANVAPEPAVPTSAPQYTLDMIAIAGSALIDAGKIDQLMQLLGKFGVASLTDLAPESYGAVANELRSLGAAI